MAHILAYVVFPSPDGPHIYMLYPSAFILRPMSMAFRARSWPIMPLIGSSSSVLSKLKPSKSHQPEGRMVKLSGMVEKPKQEEAPSNLAVMGRYVLTPEIFEMLETQEAGAGGEIQLTDAIDRLMDRQAVYAYDFEGQRYDVGDKFGFIKATIDFSLNRDDLKDQVAAYLKQLNHA